MLGHQEEGFISITTVLQPVERSVGHDICHIPSVVLTAAILLNKVGIIVFPLPRKNLPVIVTLGCRDEVPLANQCSLVASLLQQFGKGRLTPIEMGAAVIIQVAVNVAMLAGLDGSTGGTADRVRAVGAGKDCTLISDAVEIWRRRDIFKRAVVSRNRIQRMII